MDKIPVKISRPVYIRKGPGKSHKQIGVAQASGKTILMDGVKEDGETLKGISRHYYQLNEKGEKQWYWGGRVEEVITGKIEFMPNKMSWAHDSVNEGGLGIVDLWNKMGTRGTGVNVAIFDTGISSKKYDFTNVIETSLIAGLYQPTIDDFDNHGTNSAGILAATGGNLVYGIAPDVNLYIFKFSPYRTANSERFKKGLETLITKNWPIDILSISYCYHDKTLLDICNSLSKDVIVISALYHLTATDISFNNDQYPAACENIIPVTAIKQKSNKKLTANDIVNPCELIDNKINWAFPGDHILTLNADGNCNYCDQTSIATPLGAGVFALYVSYMKLNGIPLNYDNIQILKKLFTEQSTNSVSIQRNGIDKQVQVCYCRPYEAFTSFNQYFKI